MSASNYQTFLYRNAIEPLVIAEVEQQLKKLSPNILKYINSAQIVAYALNRLPALYATSKEGWSRQQLRAKKQMRDQITTAVRQGLIAVQRDPLKSSTPLLVEEEVKSEVQTQLQTQIQTQLQTQIQTEVQTQIQTEVQTQVNTQERSTAEFRNFCHTEKRSFFMDGWDAG